MALFGDTLPQLDGGIFMAYSGMETDLLFTKGAELPGFASYPLLESEAGRALLTQSYQALIDVAQAAGVGVILESTTWLANRDRGAAIGYGVEALRTANRDAMAFLQSMRHDTQSVPVLLSANVGPREDAYAPSDVMSVADAAAYHSEQVALLADTQADFVSGYTLSTANEAAGIALAAKRFGLPVVIAFTVETDGRLPDGTDLVAAIETVDASTDGYPAYFMVNCAHPEHFNAVLDHPTCRARLKGVVTNASRCSHAELDEAEVLDSGDPLEFGQLLAQIHATHPQITVLGGCCGTDMRHLQQVLAALGITNRDV